MQRTEWMKMKALKIVILLALAPGGFAATHYVDLNSANPTPPGSVTNIGSGAFEDCQSLTSVTIGNGVTSTGVGAFSDCYSLTAVYFLGNAPSDPGDVFDDESGYYDPVIVYYLPGATGWGPFFSGVPTVRGIHRPRRCA
jgi:hypothetical protein